MAVSRKVCVTSTILGVLVSAVVVGLCVWFAVPHSNNDNGSNAGNSNNTSPIPPEPPLNIYKGLLIHKGTEIQLKAIDGINDVTISLVKLDSSIGPIDYYRNKTVYYSTMVYPIASVSKEYPKLMPFNDRNWFATALAVDIICKNVYVYDQTGEKMYVIDIQNKHTGIIFSDLPRVKDIAINPLLRSIFMLTSSSIFMAHMDGEEFDEIVKDNDIEAFALNLVGPYVYWAKKNKIMSLHVNIGNSVDVATTTNTIRSLAVFDKDLYFTTDLSANNRSTDLYSCQIDLNGACSGQFRKIVSDNPQGVKVYVPHIWENSPNPCEYQNGGCEQLCLLKRESEIGRSCACAIGWQLNADMQTCSPVEDYIMYVNSFYLRGRIMDRGSNRAFVDAIAPRRLDMNQIPEEGAVEFDFDSRRHRVIFRDRYGLHQLDLLGKDKDRQIGENLTYAMYPAIDWITSGNLYYLKASRRSGFESYVMLRGYTTFNDYYKNEKEIHKFEKTQHPQAIVVVPNQGCLFVSVYEESLMAARIYKIVADGSTSAAFDVQNDEFSVNETGLGIDHVDNTLYWFSADLTKVQYANIDALDFKSFDISFVKEPKWLNIHGQWLYISSLEGTWRVDKMTGLLPQRILSTTVIHNFGLSAAKGFGTSVQPIRIDHPCAMDNGGCSRYCIAVPGTMGSLRRVCTCNDNEKLKEDGKSCAFVPETRI